MPSPTKPVVSAPASAPAPATEPVRVPALSPPPASSTPAPRSANAQARAIARQDASRRAREAVAAVRAEAVPPAPVPAAAPAASAAEPSPTQPPAASSADGTASTAAPAAASVTPPSEPAVEPTPALRGGWDAVAAAERKVSEDRAAIKREREAFEAQQAQLRADLDRLRAIEEGLRSDPTALLGRYGWEDERLAQHIVSKYKSDGTAAAPPPAPAAPAAPAQDETVAALQQRIAMMELAMVRAEYRAKMNDSKYDVLRQEADGVDRAIDRVLAHYERTGQQLTPEQALDMVQDELIAAEKARWAARQSNPSWQKALGLTGSPAPAATSGQPGATPPPAASSSVEPPVTSITNDLSGSRGVPPSPGPVTDPRKRLEQTMNAIRLARAQQG